MTARSLLLPLMTLTATALAAAEPTLRVPQFFADHMILQRDLSVPVWGHATPGAEVRVEFAGQQHTAETGEDGRWTVRLDPLKGSAEGKAMQIVSGEDSISLEDVLVGEVWICSGQSNMDYSVGRGGDQGWPAGLDAAKYPKIRQFKSDRKRLDGEGTRTVTVGEWSVCDQETVKNFTAVGFHFAVALHDELKVPIGLLNCSRGSTICRSWAPGGLMYRQRVEPWLPWAARGAIWYQGEHNAGNPDAYGPTLTMLIEGWRKEMALPELSFYVVQLPNFCEPNPDPAGGDGWARIREEQLHVTQALPRTGLAVTTDTGLADDAHPFNKYDHGLRLARWALAKDYGLSELVHSGPVFKEMTIEGGKARLSFDSAGSGLMVGKKEDLKPAEEVSGGTLGGFAIAGEDQAWHWAEAEIDGMEVVLSSPKVLAPAAVRYAYSSNPTRANLYNREGLPTGPFRTDTWPIPDEVMRTLRGRGESVRR